MRDAWGQVENVYERRANLIPNLAAAVKSYATYEQKLFEAITEARLKSISTSVEMNGMTDEQLISFENTQNEISNNIGRLIAIAENYPELKASDNYLTLHAQLEGCENRIQIERKKFNDMARRYNRSIRRFPSNIIAKLFHFKRQPYFEGVSDHIEQTPKL